MNYDHACVTWTPEDTEDLGKDVNAPSQKMTENSDTFKKVNSNLEQAETPK